MIIVGFSYLLFYVWDCSLVYYTILKNLFTSARRAQVRVRGGGALSAGTSAEAVRGRLQLVLLDFGLAEELTPGVRHHFISFLHMIAAGALLFDSLS